MVKQCLKFSATWCGPCKVLEPIFDNVSKNEEFKDVEFIKYDIEDEAADELVGKFGIRSVPTLVLLDEEGNVLKKSVGSISESTLTEILKSEM